MWHGPLTGCLRLIASPVWCIESVTGTRTMEDSRAAGENLICLPDQDDANSPD